MNHKVGIVKSNIIDKVHEYDIPGQKFHYLDVSKETGTSSQEVDNIIYELRNEEGLVIRTNEIEIAKHFAIRFIESTPDGVIGTTPKGVTKALMEPIKELTSGNFTYVCRYSAEDIKVWSNEFFDSSYGWERSITDTIHVFIRMRQLGYHQKKKERSVSE